MKIKNISKLIIIQSLFGYICFAEEGLDGRFFKKFTSGIIFTHEMISENSETMRVSTGKSSLHLTAESGRPGELTVMIRGSKSVIFSTDFNFDANWDLKEEYTLESGEIGKEPMATKIYFDEKWQDVKKEKKHRGFIDKNGIEYIFNLDKGQWSAIESSPP